MCTNVVFFDTCLPGDEGKKEYMAYFSTERQERKKEEKKDIPVNDSITHLNARCCIICRDRISALDEQIRLHSFSIFSSHLYLFSFLFCFLDVKTLRSASKLSGRMCRYSSRSRNDTVKCLFFSSPSVLIFSLFLFILIPFLSDI